MPTGDVEQELMALVAESIAPGKRGKLSKKASLKEVGLDSLTLMIVVSQFLERHPMPTAPLERLLPNIQTVGDLVEAGRIALESASSAAAPHV